MSLKPSSPESEEIALCIRNAGVQITQFQEYSFNSHFLTPTDGWSFTLGSEQIRPEIERYLVPGAAVDLVLNGFIQSSGFVDSIEKAATRDGGIEWHVEGRDRLAQAVDACTDPTQSLKESMTLIDALKTIFAPFGWGEITDFVETNEISLQLKSGVAAQRRKTASSDAKGFGRRALKEYKLHQLRPYPREGAFEFASRIAQRFGLWIWATPNGDQLVVGEPDFGTEPLYRLIRNSRGDTNVLSGSVKFDLSEQPTTIVADSYSQAGEFLNGRYKAVMGNLAVRFADESYIEPDVDRYIRAGARVIAGPTFPESSRMVAPRPRVLYLHDDESQTPEQLENFVRREMSLLQRKSLTANYTVQGHGQVTDKGAFVPWTVDSTVSVEDEVAGLSEVLYVLGRTFTKSRSSGTATHLELIRLNTLIFSDTGK